jgi:hypothetical protein
MEPLRLAAAPLARSITGITGITDITGITGTTKIPQGKRQEKPQRNPEHRFVGIPTDAAGYAVLCR